MSATRSNLKSGALVLMLALAAASPAVGAQDLTVSWNPRSGDVWVDTLLNDVNRYGYEYREPFIDEMVRYHAAPRPLVVELIERRRWAPGDVYYACSIAAIIGRPCRHVVDMYEADRGQGWGVIAQRLGIKPGSPEFHQLKKGFVPTYDRWARPIDLDDDLRRAFPGRAKGGKGPGGGVVHAGDHGKSGAKGAAHGGSKSAGHGKGGGKPAGQATHKGGSGKSASHGGGKGGGGKSGGGKGGGGKSGGGQKGGNKGGGKH
ncbi:hypothetical protein [Agrilutibacter solisilvae]|uniref:Uncharacterized protein n=1 Tax=Agrilutibacter solisilvae TaxID=2763317 RepID=A0A974Y1E2_9GAMM|nr:hypothetical protein [Lysobacter solisilvae]QSX79544.1 hypothetical protein I8J32_006740 [Lysobacter solisilvae]